MKIWEDEKQVYIRAAMERNTPEQNAALKERLEQIDWSILEHIQRKETVNERGVFTVRSSGSAGDRGAQRRV